jgi:SnoaL-like domain
LAHIATMTATDLVDLELIKQLKHKYMRCLDQKRWDEIAECFTEDAVASYSAGKYAFDGRAAIVGFFRTAMDRKSFLSSHRVHQPEIVLTSPTTATGVWAMEDYVIDTERNITIHGAAFYSDDYVKLGDRWLISRIGYERTFEEVQPRDGKSPPVLTASFWGTGGRSELPTPKS